MVGAPTPKVGVSTCYFRPFFPKNRVKLNKKLDREGASVPSTPLDLQIYKILRFCRIQRVCLPIIIGHFLLKMQMKLKRDWTGGGP